ncbi:MAG: ATP-binding protein [Chloroflexales bacterium]|nr:ATP-binding protein [Chloroflexales bacterium]
MQHKKPLQEKLSMVANETILVRAQPWLRSKGRDGIRAILPLPAFGIVWWFASLHLGPISLAALIVYAIVNLALLIWLRRAQDLGRRNLAMTVLILLAISDGLLALLLLRTIGPLNLAIFPMYAVLAIKAFRYRRQFLWMLLVPTLVGPVYLSTLYLDVHRPSGLSFEQVTAYWGLVVGSFLFVGLLLVLSEYRLRENARLSQQLEHEYTEHALRLVELDSINTDLRVRIRSQQALEESLRAITGSLSLDDVLKQILDSMMQMLGTARVSAAALTLVDGTEFSHRSLSLDLNMTNCWAEPLARHVVQQHTAIVVGDTLQEREWRELYRCGVVSALSVPLVDVNDTVRGALTVVSVQRHAFNFTEVRYLNSFSIQASVAIHNAELHSQLARQQVMLEAVLRNIGDALVVLDGQGDIVLANTVAYKELANSDALKFGLRERLVQTAVDLRAAGHWSLSRELHFGERDDESVRVYRAFASLVRISDQAPSYVAIVLHDITNDKAEERARTEFISMVSHELRNPLNTLNGFLKVVLQGRAGPLSELQQEFLELADGQANQLKGRITELLEFNRLEAGRLRIQPAWCDLSVLITEASVRLQLQAEQSGLQLSCNFPEHIPEVLIDHERINQVITNLVENAIKATASGGAIAISVDVCDTEVRVHVTDTGVGIPPEEQSKIFNRFYRLHHKASHHGAHLGLGLSICQQIIEGHNGHIWVESEEGKGSRFSFSLPLFDRERVLGGNRAA